MLITAISSWVAARKDQVQISKFRDDIARCDQERAKAQEVLDRSENRTTRDQSKLSIPYPPQVIFLTQVFSDLELMMPHELHVTSDSSRGSQG